MVTSTPRTPSDAQPPAQETLAALRAGGPSALAELLGDVDHLLSEVATAPKAMFSPHGRARAEYKNLLDMVHAARSALEVLEVRTMVALAEVTTRDAVHAAQNDAAHEDDFLPPLEQLITQSDAKTAQDVSLATRRSPSVANSTMATSRRLVTSMPGCSVRWPPARSPRPWRTPRRPPPPRWTISSAGSWTGTWSRRCRSSTAQG